MKTKTAKRPEVALVNMSHFGELTPDLARRIKAAQSQIIETTRLIAEREWTLTPENLEALDLQAWRMFALNLVRDGLLSMEEVNIRHLEEKAAELDRQFQEQCTKTPEQRAESKIILLHGKNKA